jgi:putative RNA 2'-phosphotransferase
MWASSWLVLAGTALRSRARSCATSWQLATSSAFSEDGRRIRANQGHSRPVDLGLRPTGPPATLFHGTVERAVESILATGLERRSRQYVHLSADTATARRVGARRGSPVVLQIDAAAMACAGHLFYLSQNGVWLVEAVPPEYISR